MIRVGLDESQVYPNIWMGPEGVCFHARRLFIARLQVEDAVVVSFGILVIRWSIFVRTSPPLLLMIICMSSCVLTGDEDLEDEYPGVRGAGAHVHSPAFDNLS